MTIVLLHAIGFVLLVAGLWIGAGAVAAALGFTPSASPVTCRRFIYDGDGGDSLAVLVKIIAERG